MPYLFHAFPFCTCRVTECPHQRLNHRAAQAVFFGNRDFLQQKQNRTNACEPRASPSLKGSKVTNTMLRIGKFHQATEEARCVSRAAAPFRQQGHGQASEASREPRRAARANSSPPRPVSVQFAEMHPCEAPSRTKLQQGAGA